MGKPEHEIKMGAKARINIEQYLPSMIQTSKEYVFELQFPVTSE
jgi:hypothetical protein